MLFHLDSQSKVIESTKKISLNQIAWKEEDLQNLLHDNLAEIFPDDDLLLIRQAHRGNEEPDLMAVDKNGSLIIFELKATESKDFNVLQALKYGQIFGQYSYDSLNKIYKKTNPNGELLDSLRDKFDVKLTEREINQKQKFVIITNGIDFKTRQAILYWSKQGLDIQCWIYRIHEIYGQQLIEFDRFRILDDPFEDLESSYYILNTNIKNSTEDDRDMLNEGKAAAYFDPWKRKIMKLHDGDTVFLYRSGVGIVAKGKATGQNKMKNYHGDSIHPDEEYYQKLRDFQKFDTPISPSEIKRISGVSYFYMQTMFRIDEKTGKKLWRHSNP